MLSLKKQERLVRVKDERPNHPSRSHARQGVVVGGSQLWGVVVEGVQLWGAVVVVGGVLHDDDDADVTP